MKIVLFPGSFKPPHRGHLKAIENVMKKYKPDIFYLIISRKPRIIEAPFEKKLHEFSNEELSDLAKKYKIKKVNKSTIETALTNGTIPAVSAKTTLEFWKEYLKLLPKKYVDKIKVSISPLPSPVLYSFVIVKNKVKPDDELILVKAEKNADNTRFSMFDRLNVKKKEVLIPTFRDFNSWQMRKAIQNKDWKKVKTFLPKLDSDIQKKLLGLLAPIKKH